MAGQAGGREQQTSLSFYPIQATSLLDAGTDIQCGASPFPQQELSAKLISGLTQQCSKTLPGRT